MDYLPSDVCTTIFLKLSVKTIVRCTCVCISWKKIIEDPSFINAHLQIQRRDLMLVRNCQKIEGSKGEAYTLYCDDDTLKMYKKLDFPFTHRWHGYYQIIGSCNGVICLTSGRYSMKDTYLWNPTVRKFVELPLPRVTKGSHKGFEHANSFGYDAKNNNFKVIRIVEFDKMGENWAPLEVQIYTLNSGIWRDISHLASDIKCPIYKCGRQAYLNEAAHWVAKIPNAIVVSFHFGQELFRCFEFPTAISCQNPKDLNLWLVVVQGSLSLTQQCKETCIILMMKDYGDSSSWIKWLDVNLSNKVQRLIGFTEKSELIFQIEGRLYSFDHEKVDGKDVNVLEGNHLATWEYVQRGYRSETFFYPDTPPIDLGIHRKIRSFRNGNNFFYCEKYLESLALIAKSTVTPKLANVRVKKNAPKAQLRKAKTVSWSGSAFTHYQDPALLGLRLNLIMMTMMIHLAKEEVKGPDSGAN